MTHQGRPIAVFCDFDGTFAIQDVGRTISTTRRSDVRPGVLALVKRGDLTPWEANLRLLDGLPMPEAELDAFLETIELDPGARSLIAWCDDHDARFEILSDGFDYNLDRLQQIHGVEFAYRANRLRFDDGAWSIEAGSPNPECGCGTGTCKRAVIEAWHRDHPGVLCVHIGNGSISDLCGALAADRVFAKETLAEALYQRGIDFGAFETLHDVVDGLDALVKSPTPP